MKIEKPEISEKLIDKLLEEEKEICHHCRAWNVFIKGCDGWQESCRPRMKAMVASLLSAVRDGKAEILCPECNEPIKVLKCEGCHLENVDGYIRH